MAKTEAAGCGLAGAVAAIVRGSGFVAVGRHGDPTCGRPGLERSDAGGRQCGRHRQLTGLDLRMVGQGNRGGGLDPLGEDQVPCLAWIAPQHGTAGGAVSVLELGRFLRIARSAVEAAPQRSLAGAPWRDVDPVGVSAPVWSHSAEHGAGVVADQRRFGPFAFRGIVVRERSPAGDWGRRHRHLIRCHVEAMGEVRADQIVIAFISRRRQQAPGVGLLIPLTVVDLDQLAEAQDFGNAQLGRLEVDPLDMHQDIEDRV